MQVLDNFESSYNKFLDARQSWDSLEALQENTDILMPNGFKAFCKEENKWYILSTEDETDPSTYNWNESDGISIIELTQAEYDLLVENEEIENDRLYLITDGENYEGGSGGKGFDIVDEMPDTAPEKSIVFYNGKSTVDYTKGSFYQMINGNWIFLGATVKLIEVPFSFSLKSISPISENERSRELIFTSSEEIAITQETFNGVVASGVIQGKIWNDIGGSISQVDETTFRVILDIDAADSLGQPAQFVSGSSITIPAFSLVNGITKYTHAAETISISETTVQQKLLFNTTGNFDTNTASTSFTISGAYEIPFVLSYMNIPPVAMMDSNYEAEVIQSWTSSIVAANDTTTLVFTPNDSTALHGDNIAITAGRLTATANGVTYTYDFSTDNINLRWGNTSYNLGTFNNFASFTAVPTSDGAGSVTCTLSPTGIGDNQFELDIMAANLPTVTIDSVECETVTWTQGQIVASDASGITVVGGKTVNIVWNDDVYSDTDSYGIARTVTFVAKALSTTCGYIEKAISFSNPVPSLVNSTTQVALTVTDIGSHSVTLTTDDYTAKLHGVQQIAWGDFYQNGNMTISGTSAVISSHSDSVDRLGQRVVCPSGSSYGIMGFEVIDGDMKFTHSTETIDFSESSIGNQSLDLNLSRVVTKTVSGDRYYLKFSDDLTTTTSIGWNDYAGSCEFNIVNSNLAVYTTRPNFTCVSNDSKTFQIYISGQRFLWGSDINVAYTWKPLSFYYDVYYSACGVTWYIGSQNFTLTPETTVLSASITGIDRIDSYSYAYGEPHVVKFLSFITDNNSPALGTLVKKLLNGKVTITTTNGTYTPDLENDYNVVSMMEFSKSGSIPTVCTVSGTVICQYNVGSESYMVPNSDGFIANLSIAVSGTTSGTHTYDNSVYDDDDCDDD